MSARYPEPIMGKRTTGGSRSHLRLTWPRMLRIRAWAQWAAVEAGAPVYLVGSALDHDRPRDVDVAIVWPRAEFERLWGDLPRRQEEFGEFWQRPAYQHGKHSFNISAREGAGYKPYLDVHLTPDVWWAERPRLLIGDPNATNRPTIGHQGEELYLPRCITHTQTKDNGCIDPDGLTEVLFDWDAVKARRPGEPFARGVVEEGVA